MGYLERVFRSTEELNRREILSMVPRVPRGALLDIGTHTGEFSARVAEAVGAEVVMGLEFIDEHAAEARKRGIDAVVGDIEDGLPFPDSSFDVVHANQVIEHVRSTDLFLSEIRRVLKPAGVACVSTNNLSSLHNVFSLLAGLQPTPMHVSDEVIVGNPLDPLRGQAHEDRGQTHLRLFTARALRELAAHHGLKTIEARGVGYYPLPTAVARPVARLDPLHAAFVTALFARD